MCTIHPKCGYWGMWRGLVFLCVWCICVIMCINERIEHGGLQSYEKCRKINIILLQTLAEFSRCKMNKELCQFWRTTTPDITKLLAVIHILLLVGRDVARYFVFILCDNVIAIPRRGINCFECTLYMLNLTTFHNNLVIVFVWGRLPCKS